MMQQGDNNKIGTEGAKAIAQALTHAQAQAQAQAQADNQSLRSLDLSDIQPH
jgi:hypothetical protein